MSTQKYLNLCAIFGSIIMLSMVLLTSGCIDRGSKGGHDIVYGGQYYPEEFVLKGKNDGFWKTYDLKVDHILFQSGNEGNQALISGEIDVVIGSDSKTVSVFNAIPEKAVIIGTSQKGDRYSTIVKKGSDYESWFDLTGKTVATKMGTGAEQVLRRYFDGLGNLSWDDFEWVNLDISEMASQLDNGNIEAFTAWEPTPAIAEAKGIGRLLRTFGDIAPVPVSLTTTLDFVENHREALVKFLAAHMDKAALIENDPDEAAELAANAASDLGSDVSKDAFLRIFDRIDFSIDFDMSVIASINNTAQFLVDQGKIDTAPPVRWDLSLLEEAKALRS